MRVTAPLSVALFCAAVVVMGSLWHRTSHLTPKKFTNGAGKAVAASSAPFQSGLLPILRARRRSVPFHACFAPDTQIERVERFHRELHAPDLVVAGVNPGASSITRGHIIKGTEVVSARVTDDLTAAFQAPDSNRWLTTATNGGGLSQGDPITLTWGIVSDSTFIPAISQSDETGAGANSSLRARLNAIYGSETNWLPIFEAVFDRWEELTGITYVYEPNDDSADLFNASGQVGIRPDVRIGGRRIDGNRGILAFNFFPDNGDMVIDTDDSFYDNTSENSLGFRNVLSHEHGHGLGIGHVCPVQQTKLMEPFVSTQFDGPQHDDIRAGQRLYGDRFEDNDNLATAADLGVFSIGVSQFQDVSLDGSIDNDYYKFTTNEFNLEVKLTVTPVGFTYLNGAQNNDGSCQEGASINTLDDRNLRIELLDSVGTVIGSVNANPAGQSESLSHALGASTGPFYARIAGDAVNSVQLYSLQLAFAASAGDDLVVLTTAPSSTVPLGEVQTVSVLVSHSGPNDATDVVATVPMPTGLDYVGSYMTSGSGTFSFANNQVTAMLGLLAGQTSVAFDVRALRSTASDIMITASVTRAEVDPILSNNTASLASLAALTTATNIEDFDAFPGFSGIPPTAIPNDTTGSFELFWGGNTTTQKGYALDGTEAPNGRGLNYDAAEDTSIWPSTPFSEQDFTEGSYQIAFWFRYSDKPAGVGRDFTQMLVPVNQRAIDDRPDVMAFVLSCGRDQFGVQGIEVRVPSSNQQIIRYTNNVPTVAALWHQCVVQYTSASSLSAADAGLKLYIDPEDGDASPSFSIETTSGNMTSYLGDGPLGRYSFAAAHDYADPNGPEIWIDRVGSWDGFGSPGKNDLQAAIDFFYPMGSVQSVASSLVEGASNPFEFRVFRKEEIHSTVNYDWVVSAVDGSSIGPEDFVGGVLPSGQVSFVAGQTVETIQVQVADDDFLEADERFEVVLSSGDDVARVNPALASAAATVVDDDGFGGEETYAQRASNAFVASPPAEQDDYGNPDDDRWPNAFEYLFGTDPELHDSDPVILTIGDSIAWITYPRAPEVPMSTEILEASTDLDDWIRVEPLSIAVQTQSGQNDMLTIAVPYNVNVRVFYRLRIP